MEEPAPMLAIPAARRMYEMMDLRRWLLELVDRSTLARMMTLEKDAVYGGAAVLYKNIHLLRATQLLNAEKSFEDNGKEEDCSVS